MAIYRKLQEIQSSIRGLTKDKAAYNYDYVTGDKLLSHIRPMMNNLSLLLLPSVTDVESLPITYEVWDKAAKGIIKKTEVLYTVKLEMKWVDTEDGEVLVETWAGTGQNSFDKGFGSALTYGERYYLLKTFHIPTDKDDVDAIATARDQALEDGYKAQARTYKPVDEATMQKMAALYARGVKSKTGQDYRSAWIAHTNPGEEEIAIFDKMVVEYAVANNIRINNQ